MTSTAESPHRSGASLLRRIIVAIIVVAFAVAAIGGIVVLLGANLGDPAYRVLSTTAVVGLFSIAVLCCASLIGKPLAIVGVVGAAVSIIAAGLVIWLIWQTQAWGPEWDTFYRLMWTAVAASVAFSLASLLLLLVRRRRPVVRIGLFVTLALVVLLLGLTIYLIWAAEDVDYEVFPRVYGIVAILTALGAIVVPVLSLLIRDEPAPGASLSPAAEALLVEEAARRGITPDELVRELIGAPVAAVVAAPAAPPAEPSAVLPAAPAGERPAEVPAAPAEEPSAAPAAEPPAEPTPRT